MLRHDAYNSTAAQLSPLPIKVTQPTPEARGRTTPGTPICQMRTPRTSIGNHRQGASEEEPNRRVSCRLSCLQHRLFMPKIKKRHQMHKSSAIHQLQMASPSQRGVVVTVLKLVFRCIHAIRDAWHPTRVRYTYHTGSHRLEPCGELRCSSQKGADLRSMDERLEQRKDCLPTYKTRRRDFLAVFVHPRPGNNNKHKHNLPVCSLSGVPTEATR